MLERKVVNGVIIDDKERILLLHRRKDRKGTFRNLWHTFSGTIEKDETKEQCLERELKEELGVTEYGILKIGEPWLDEFSSTKYKFLVYVYLLKLNQEFILDEKEHDKYVWAYPNEIKKYKTISGFHKNLEQVGIRI